MIRDEGFLFPREDRIRLTKSAKEKLFSMITERDHGLCVYCLMALGVKSKGWHHHHVKPLGTFGGDTADNLVLLCYNHHNGDPQESAHGVLCKRVRAVLEDYLKSDYVKGWIADHKDELDELYSHRYSQTHKRKK